MPPATPVNLNNPQSVRSRLDELYIKLGRTAAGFTLPAALARSQAAALQAVSEYTQSKNNLEDAQREASCG